MSSFPAVKFGVPLFVLVLVLAFLFAPVSRLQADAEVDVTEPAGARAGVYLPFVTGPLDEEALKDIGATSHGNAHGCALTTSGGVKCWGQNLFGKVGDGTTSDRLHAVDVRGLSSGAKAVSAGFQHTCAIQAGGGVLCWGSNIFGQLGTGAFDNSRTPVQVSGLTSGFTSVVAGERHSCALSDGGGVKCWGDNSVGNLGNGLIEPDRRTPVDVSGLGSGVTQLALGTNHTCALLAGGSVRCWGQGFFGQVGNGSAAAQLTPVQVSGLTSGVKAIAAAGDNSCALLQNGTVRCWGRNDGLLGTGSDDLLLTPAPVVGLPQGITSIAMAFSHTCAIAAHGDVWCWGTNGSGELGADTEVDEIGPVQVEGLGRGAKAVMLNTFYSCALLATTQVMCWGSNNVGQLGNGNTTDQPIPGLVRVVPL